MFSVKQRFWPIISGFTRTHTLAHTLTHTKTHTGTHTLTHSKQHEFDPNVFNLEPATSSNITRFVCNAASETTTRRGILIRTPPRPRDDQAEEETGPGPGPSDQDSIPTANPRSVSQARAFVCGRRCIEIFGESGKGCDMRLL